jgi:hypothetical protein
MHFFNGGLNFQRTPFDTPPPTLQTSKLFIFSIKPDPIRFADSAIEDP